MEIIKFHTKGGEWVDVPYVSADHSGWQFFHSAVKELGQEGYVPITARVALEQLCFAWKTDDKDLRESWEEKRLITATSIREHPDGRIKIVDRSDTLPMFNYLGEWIKISESLYGSSKSLNDDVHTLPSCIFETSKGRSFSRDEDGKSLEFKDWLRTEEGMGDKRKFLYDIRKIRPKDHKVLLSLLQNNYRSFNDLSSTMLEREVDMLHINFYKQNCQGITERVVAISTKPYIKPKFSLRIFTNDITDPLYRNQYVVGMPLEELR